MDNVMCCFCGEYETVTRMVLVQLHVHDTEGWQEMFAHKKCLVEHINPKVPLLLSITEDDSET